MRDAKQLRSRTFRVILPPRVPEEMARVPPSAHDPTRLLFVGISSLGLVECGKRCFLSRSS